MDHGNEQYPPCLNRPELEHLVSTVQDWAIANGLVVRPPAASFEALVEDQVQLLATSVPLTLFPSQFPRQCFEQAKSIQCAYNMLYARIARDESFLKNIVEQLLDVDDFIAQLWQIHLQVKDQGYTQHLSLGIFRSDYMIHQPSPEAVPCIKQVEFNTIASSFGPLSTKTSALHKYLSTTVYPEFSAAPKIKAASLPPNCTTSDLAYGLLSAHRAYIALPTTFDSSSRPLCCVLFLVQAPEKNIFDQRHLEYAFNIILPHVPVFRVTLSEFMSRTSLASSRLRQLLYQSPHDPHGKYEVTVVYLRAGYSPADYPTPLEWSARLRMEESHAIKCPSILIQLAGVKKVQQVLAAPSSDSVAFPVLARFYPDLPGSSLAERLASTFTHIFPLDDSPAGLAARQIALDEQTCQGYVLKPQREGGGNNIYRAAIPAFLRALPEKQWKSYILMEMITPPPTQNKIFRNGVIEQGGVVNELGVYGVCLWDSRVDLSTDVEPIEYRGEQGMLLNMEAGYLLRTKGDHAEEGGVSAGFGSMDSCWLV